jgi:rubrerythrin
VAGKRKHKHDDLAQHWICEDCEKPHVGKDPPDECSKCAGRYFDNLQDILKGKAEIDG